ncbi:hypothetical protein [Streptomyces sp. 7-21]|mgnify:CR=1 FL=1|uniref:hypothetical protein n=1 Tax=Streptomyces sp. 7-21 TaxID=2802283 RepID=UPI00191DB664|nr:hypothetical protein [Streptomyces sp. 7-21]MBL1066008.1 hypothetical protein [Streptomyces sp. 7-21]
MKSPKSPRRRPARATAAGAATATLALCLSALTALAAAPASAAGGDTAPLTVSPGAGSAETAVTVTTTCRPDGHATSEAFQDSVGLEQAGDGTWTGTAAVKPDGLVIGRSYPVAVRCDDGVTLSTSFTFTAGMPHGGVSAGFGGGAEDGGARATALAIGGGIAISGAVAYALLSRRPAARWRRLTGSRY